MTEPRRPGIEIVRAQNRTAVPTGPDLLRLVRAAGDAMLVELRLRNLGRYRELKTFYIELLEIAQNDAYCSPILVQSVQAVFDEESAIHRSGQQRLDKGT